ncbi:MAG: hypothetical protein LBK95_11480 [Bifidobacteriaceae bacterium]|nr:hypothetical protein [Bifidobacteriaceae bacterium]
MIEESRIVGFVGDYAGDTDLLTCNRPVVEIGGQLFVALSENWTFGELRPLDASEHGYVNLGLANGDSPIPAREGLLVCLAGGGFINTLLLTPRLRVHTALLAGWSKYRGGFSYYAFSKVQFDELRRVIYSDLKAALLNSLYSTREMEDGTTGALAYTFAMLPPEDPREQLLVEALYYWEARELDQVGITREFAVDEGLFETADDFDASLEQFRRSMAQPRLREGKDADARRESRWQGRSTDTVLDELKQLMDKFALWKQGTLNEDRWGNPSVTEGTYLLRIGSDRPEFSKEVIHA